MPIKAAWLVVGLTLIFPEKSRLTLLGLQCHMWGQTSQIPSVLPPKRDCSPKKADNAYRGTHFFPPSADLLKVVVNFVRFFFHRINCSKCACVFSPSCYCKQPVFLGVEVIRLQSEHPQINYRCSHAPLCILCAVRIAPYMHVLHVQYCIYCIYCVRRSVLKG